MALDATQFKTMVAGANQIHHYNTPDAIATVTASGYFNAITARLKRWDIIHVVGLTGGATTIDNVIVTSATGAATVTTTAVEGVTTS